MRWALWLAMFLGSTAGSRAWAGSPAPEKLSLTPGLCLLSAPLDLSTTRPYTARDLLEDVGTPFVARPVPTSGGSQKFDVYLPLLGLTPFPLKSGEGYLVRSPAERSFLYTAARSRPPGTIWTVAGNGRFESGGDGGPARLAGIGLPMAVEADGKGHLFIADGAFHKVWKVDLASGNIDCVAGTGATTDSLVIFVRHQRFQFREGLFSGDGGPATSAALYAPRTLRLDGAGNLYVADTGNYRVRVVDAVTGTIRTVAGDGTMEDGPDGVPAVQSPISDPKSFAVDREGNVYLNTIIREDARLRRVDRRTGIIETVGGIAGQEDSSQRRPIEFSLREAIPRFSWLRFDHAGELHALLWPVVMHFDFKSQRMTAVTSNTFPRSAPFPGIPAFPRSTRWYWEMGSPLHLADGSWLMVGDPNRVFRLDKDGFAHRFAGDWWRENPFEVSSPGRYAGDGGPAVAASLSKPEDVAIDTDGTVYIADTENHVVRAVAP